MIRGTTPTFTFKIRDENLNLNEAENVYVTIAQSGKLIERSTGDTSLNVDGRTVSLWLTQEESLRLTEGVNAEVQINWTYMDSDGVTVRRAATKLKTIPITKQLLKRVIE